MRAISIDKAVLKKASNRAAEYKTPLFTAADAFFHVPQRSETREWKETWTSQDIMAELERVNPRLKKIMDDFDNGLMEFYELPDLKTEDEILQFLSER